MSAPPSGWKKGPSFVDTFYKLRELSIRVHRLSLVDKMNRTKAMLDALVQVPKAPKP